ncbi:hypothetical protein Tco_0099935 [Tanacetum coccineum]
MQVARDRQKSYADLKRKLMELQVGDKILSCQILRIPRSQTQRFVYFTTPHHHRYYVSWLLRPDRQPPASTDLFQAGKDPEFIPPEDDVLITEEQPLPAVEEEHPAPVDSTAVALPAVDHAPSYEEIKPFETDKEEVERLLALPSPPPSPLTTS